MTLHYRLRRLWLQYRARRLVRQGHGGFAALLARGKWAQVDAICDELDWRRP